MTRKHWVSDTTLGVFVLLCGTVALVTAWIAQNILNMQPCELCLWERWPYRIVAILGIIYLLVRFQKLRLFLLWFICLTLLVEIGLGVIHVGVEWHLWASPTEACRLAGLPKENITDMLASLPLVPVKACDVPDYFVTSIPISVAMIGLVYAMISLVGVLILKNLKNF